MYILYCSYMNLIQIKVEDALKEAITRKAKEYGVPASTLIKITLVKTFMQDTDTSAGNVFNADRDNNGEGIAIDDLLKNL